MDGTGDQRRSSPNVDSAYPEQEKPEAQYSRPSSRPPFRGDEAERATDVWKMPGLPSVKPKRESLERFPEDQVRRAEPDHCCTEG